MNIQHIRVWDFSPLFRDGPYEMSFVSQTNAFGRILQFETQDGFIGVGEVVFHPILTADQRATLIEEETNYLSNLIDQPIESVIELAQRLRAMGKQWYGVSFALETAAFDILARRQRLPLSRLWSAAPADSINSYFSISERTTDQIQARLSVAGKNRSILQLKTAVGSLDDDIAQIKSLLAGMSSQQTVLVDANGGWDTTQAHEVISHFDDPRIVWEDPCESYEDNLSISKAVPYPIMFDMCVRSVDVVKRAVNEPTVAAICIKPAAQGSLLVAREIRDLCAMSAKQMRIDGPWCGDIASAAILHLALGAPSDLVIAGCDLREPLDIDIGLQGVIEQAHHRIAPPPGHGIGIDLESSKLGPPERLIT